MRGLKDALTWPQIDEGQILTTIWYARVKMKEKKEVQRKSSYNLIAWKLRMDQMQDGGDSR